MGYTYDQTKILDWGVDRMRLDLGDVDVENGPDSCALSDEEYEALIADTYGSGRTRKYAQLRCLQVIVARMAMMTDVHLDGLTLDMGERYERWRIMLRCKQELFKGMSAPLSSRATNNYQISKGMHDNPRAIGGVG